MTRDRPSAPPSGDGAQISPTCLLCSSSVRIFWHIQNAIPTSSAASLIVRWRSERIISCTHATVSSVWEVDSLPGWGVVFKGLASTFETGIPFKCLQSTLAGLSESCLQHFLWFSNSFSQTETEIEAHALLNFLLHREMRRTLQVDVH